MTNRKIGQPQVNDLGPSLDELGTLAGFQSSKPTPAWQKVNHAWGGMPSAIHLPGGMVAGMTVDEAMAAEAVKLNAFAEQLREHFTHYEAVKAQLRELVAQRDAMRAFLGTDKPMVLVDRSQVTL